MSRHRQGPPPRDVVLVGHGTAWTVLAAVLAGTEPDVERWRTLAMPDVIVVEKTTLLEPARDAPAAAWREHLWDRLEVDAHRHEAWAVPLVQRLRDDSFLGALFPVFSHSVLHLRTGHRHDDDAQLVAMARCLPDGKEYAALAPAAGEVFGAWGEFFPWPRYPNVEATADALRDGLVTRATRVPVVHEWTLHDDDGIVARLVVTGIETAGLLGSLSVERQHPLAEAVSAARVAPHARPELTDIPETWNRVDPTILAQLTARSETGTALGTIALGVYEDRVWWAPETGSSLTRPHS